MRVETAYLSQIAFVQHFGSVLDQVSAGSFEAWLVGRRVPRLQDRVEGVAEIAEQIAGRGAETVEVVCAVGSFGEVVELILSR
jgi:hypothetical protein